MHRPAALVLPLLEELLAPLALLLLRLRGGVALDARRRAARVDAGSGEAVADFYMHLWKCFFACYALLPFVR